MNIDGIPKLVLTLPEKPHRRASAQKHFDEAGVGWVTWVSGINGEAFGVKTIHPYTVDDARDRPNAPGTFICGHHETGIFLSHYMAWFGATLVPDKYVMICEDDALFLSGWKEEVNNALRDCPEFDFMFVGSCGAQGANKRHLNGNVWDVRWPCCFHCYIISKKGADILLQTQRKVWGPVDVTVFHADPKGSQTSFDKMKVVTILPRPVTQFNTAIPD